MEHANRLMIASCVVTFFGMLGSAPLYAQSAEPALAAQAQGQADESVGQPSGSPASGPTTGASELPQGAATEAAAQPVYPPAGNSLAAGSGAAGAGAAAGNAPERVVPAYRPQRGREYDGPPLLLGRRIAVGGYGGVSTAFTQMLDRNGAAVGFEGALLLAHRLSLGFAGYGFTRTPDGPAALDGSERKFGAGYGGFVARYAFLTNLPVYFSVGAIIGGGAVVLDDMEDEDWEDDHSRDEKSDGFFMVQPELAMHANLTRWMRVGVTGGYRITSNVSRFGLTESDLNGVVLGGNLQFGWI